MDGLATLSARPCPDARILGLGPNACRTARPQGDRRRQGQDDGGSEDFGRAVRNDALRSRRYVFHGRHSYRYRELVPERPAFPNFERWYAAIASRQAFRDHVSTVPIT